MLALPGCEDPLRAFLACAAKEPLSHWQCDAELRTPALGDGYCDAQQELLLRCMSSAS
jgi:hypothetical protein